MTIEFQRPEFHASVAEVRRTSARLHHERARASREVDVLLEGWHGEAAKEFAEAWQDWRAASARVVDSLEGIADSLDRFDLDITVADERSSGSLGVLRERLS